MIPNVAAAQLWPWQTHRWSRFPRITTERPLQGLCAGGRLHLFANATKLYSYLDFLRPFSLHSRASWGCEAMASDSAVTLRSAEETDGAENTPGHKVQRPVCNTADWWGNQETRRNKKEPSTCPTAGNVSAELWLANVWRSNILLLHTLKLFFFPNSIWSNQDVSVHGQWKRFLHAFKRSNLSKSELLLREERSKTRTD